MSTMRDRGAVAVEFAIVSLILIVIIMWILDYGRFFYVQSSLVDATEQGARLAGLTDDTDAANTEMRRLLGPAQSLALGGVTVSSSACPGTAIATATIGFQRISPFPIPLMTTGDGYDEYSNSSAWVCITP